MWQFEQAVHGLADGCAQLGIPVTGGNVSLYNQTAGVNILPTPVVGVLGVIDDVRRRTIPGIGQDTGETLLLLGDDPGRVRRLGLGRRWCTGTWAVCRRRSIWRPSGCSATS